MRIFIVFSIRFVLSLLVPTVVILKGARMLFLSFPDNEN